MSRKQLFTEEEGKRNMILIYILLIVFNEILYVKFMFCIILPKLYSLIYRPLIWTKLLLVRFFQIENVNSVW